MTRQLRVQSVTTAQRSALGVMALGEVVYDSDLDAVYAGDGVATGGILIGPGSGTVGGSTTEVQFNNAGAFDGDPGLIYTIGDTQLSVANADVTGVIGISGDISATLTGPTTVHDWAPTGHATASVIRITMATADMSLTGIVAPVSPFNDGRLLVLSNIGGGFTLSLLHLTGSSAANQFSFAGHMRLVAGESILLIYDATSTKWKCIASMAPSVHTHTASTSGGVLDAAAVTTGVLGSARLGGTGTANAQAHLKGDQVWEEYNRTKSITVEDPGAAEDISMFFTDKAITVTEMNCVLVGSSTPSVTWTVRHGTDRSAAGAEVVTSGTTTTSVTTGSVVTSFNDATIIADSFVWIETTAKSGTVDELNLTIKYTED